MISSIHKNSLDSVKFTLRQGRAILLVLAARSVEECCNVAILDTVGENHG
jgi:hypothetical protein